MRSFILLLLLCPLVAFAVTQSIPDSTKSVPPIDKESTVIDSLLLTNQSVLNKQGVLTEHLIQIEKGVWCNTLLVFVALSILCVLIAYWCYAKRLRKTKNRQIDNNNNIIDKWAEFFNTAHDEFENLKLKIHHADELQQINDNFDKFKTELTKKIKDINILFKEEKSESTGQDSTKNNNSDDSFSRILNSVDNIKEHIIQTKKDIETQIENIKQEHKQEINAKTNQHKQELKKAQQESKAYRDMLCFVCDNEKETIQQYASYVLGVIELADTKVREALNNISKSEDTIIKNKAGDFIAQFKHQTQTPYYQDWISELLLLSKTGIFMCEKKASMISGILSGTSEQFDNLKYRLHKDFFSKYCSALLILYQKMKNIEKYVCSNDTGKNGKQDMDTIKKIFSEKGYSNLLELIKEKIGYSIVEVDLFKEYDDTNQDDIEIDSCSNDNYDHNVVLDICEIGVNYRSSKNKTKIKLNEK